MKNRRNFLLVYISIIVLGLFLSAYSEGNKKEEKALSHTEKLAQYVVQAKFSDFPEEVVTMGKYIIMDNIGCMLGATQTDLGKKYLLLGKNMNCGGTGCTILGSGQKASRETALYINGLLSNQLCFDDNYDFFNPFKPGIVIVPQALTLGEVFGASGQDMLTAVILAYESCSHIGRQCGNSLWRANFAYPIPIGTAVVTSRLMRLDTSGTATAIRHAGMFKVSPTRQKRDRPSNKKLGVLKIHISERNLFNLMEIYRGQQGLEKYPFLLDGDIKEWFLTGGSLEAYDKLTSQLGKTYHILDIGFSPIPAHRYTHPAATALLEALENRPVKEKDVEEIVVKGVIRLDFPGYCKDLFEAQNSMYCVLALTALGVEPGPRWYTNNRFDAPDVRALAKKIKLVNDPEAELLEMQEKIKCSVTVKFTDGTVKEATIHHIKGSHGNPMTPAEHEAKFRANCRGILDDAQVTQLIDAIMNLEKIPRLSDLIKLTATRPPI